MILTGNEIARQVRDGGIEIEPFDTERLNPNSYNVRLADELTIYASTEESGGVVDMRLNNPTRVIKIPSEGFLLQPNQFYLAHTVERTFTDSFVPCLDGRSSIARLGLQVHQTAGYGDLGFNGQWTFELKNVLPVPLRVYSFIEIGQIYFQTILGYASSYSSEKRGKYNNSTGTVASRLYQDFENGYYG